MDDALSDVVGPQSPRKHVSGKLIVVPVIVVLGMAVVCALIFGRGRTDVNGREMSTHAAVSNLKMALDTFRIECGRYPTTAEGLEALCSKPVGLPGWRGPYIDEVPVDGWGQPFVYQNPGPALAVDIVSAGPDKVIGTADDIDLKSR